jgi:hypothetical protein
VYVNRIANRKDRKREASERERERERERGYEICLAHAE